MGFHIYLKSVPVFSVLVFNYEEMKCDDIECLLHRSPDNVCFHCQSIKSTTYNFLLYTTVSTVSAHVLEYSMTYSLYTVKVDYGLGF